MLFLIISFWPDSLERLPVVSFLPQAFCLGAGAGLYSGFFPSTSPELYFLVWGATSWSSEDLVDEVRDLRWGEDLPPSDCSLVRRGRRSTDSTLQHFKSYFNLRNSPRNKNYSIKHGSSPTIHCSLLLDTFNISHTMTKCAKVNCWFSDLRLSKAKKYYFRVSNTKAILERIKKSQDLHIFMSINSFILSSNFFFNFSISCWSINWFCSPKYWNSCALLRRWTRHLYPVKLLPNM